MRCAEAPRFSRARKGVADGENRVSEPRDERGGGEYVIHQIAHNGVSVCPRVPDQQRSRQCCAQRAIKYLSTNPSRHAIRVTIRNSRFARGVTARTRSRTPNVCRYTYITRVLPQ